MNRLCFLTISLCILAVIPAPAQLITGYWKGKIDRRNVEVKIIKIGDSLTGTSYYYESTNRYARYTIKGYFNSRDNSVVWWDDRLVEEKGSKKLLPAKRQAGYFSSADFNCPGGTKMYLDGKATVKDTGEEQNRPVALEKYDNPIFTDEWDYIIDNYTLGANDPELIDSISKIAFREPVPAEPVAVIAKTPVSATTAKAPIKEPSPPVIKKEPVLKPVPVPAKAPVVMAPLTNEEKFVRRSRKLVQEITVMGDSVELHFYDNAEIDGDSIAIFLNNKLLYEHVKLTDKPYTIKLAVMELQQSNELVMVAENLGSIPPNTSLMIAEIDGKRYEARLESTEYSSAVIRFIRKRF